MSNRLYVIPTEFKDVRTGSISLGWRAYDDEGSTYDNCWDDMPADDLEFLRRVLVAHDSVFSTMLDFVIGKEDGIFIGDNWHTWDEIKPLLVEAEDSEDET